MNYDEDTLLQGRKVSSGRGERRRAYRIQTGYNIFRNVQNILCNDRRANNRTKMDTKESSVERIEDKEMVYQSTERGEIRR